MKEEGRFKERKRKWRGEGSEGRKEGKRKGKGRRRERGEEMKERRE